MIPPIIVKDWFNNHDDDGDGMVDEDYFYSEVKLNYQRNEWLTLFAGFIFKELDAIEDELTHQTHSLSLGFSVTI